MTNKDKIYYLVGKAVCNFLMFAGMASIWVVILIVGFMNNTIY